LTEPCATSAATADCRRPRCSDLSGVKTPIDTLYRDEDLGGIARAHQREDPGTEALAQPLGDLLQLLHVVRRNRGEEHRTPVAPRFRGGDQRRKIDAAALLRLPLRLSHFGLQRRNLGGKLVSRLRSKRFDSAFKNARLVSEVLIGCNSRERFDAAEARTDAPLGGNHE